MLKIPYIPTAYPDETLGSLLTRLFLHNGIGIWRHIVNEGNLRRTDRNSSFHTIPAPDGGASRLLPTLGYSYEEMLHKLTVLPFWLAFNNATSPIGRISIDKNNGSNTKLYLLRHPRTPLGSRFCPTCLQEDLESFGEPYLHRHHQLPVAIVCAKHGCWLRFTCPSCGITVLPLVSASVRPLPLRCQCGQDLRQAAMPKASARGHFLRLSQFAKNTLYEAPSPGGLEHTRSAIKSKLNIKSNNLTQTILDTFSKAYGSASEISTKYLFVHKQFDKQDIPLSLILASLRFRSPEYCALISATGMTFDEFKNFAISNSPLSTNPYTFTKRSCPIVSIEEARSSLKYFSSQFSTRALSKFQHIHPKLYWLLRLYDEAWLQKQHPGLLPITPSIESDREKIKRMLGSSKRYVRKRGPWIRAQLRDKDWMQGQIDSAVQVKAENRINALETLLHERIRNISRVIFSILMLESKPARIHNRQISKIAKLSYTITQDIIKSTPVLQLLINKINGGKNRRLAAWAARTLTATGARPTALEVLVYAGLVTTKVNRRFADEAIALFSAKQE